MKIIGALAAALLLLLTLFSAGSHDTALAVSFTPTANSVTLSNSAPSFNSEITVTYTLDSPHSMQAAHISFIPPGWSVANDAAIPNGAIVGNVSSTVSESVSNGPCNDSKLMNFTLFDATTNTSSNLLPDTPRIPSATWPGFSDANANNLPDAVDRYPTFLTALYPGLTPRSRAYGSLNALNFPVGINRVVNVLVFDPGTPLPGATPIDSALGYIVVAVWQDPTAPASPSTITDQCTPFIYTRTDRGFTQNNIDTTANEANFVYRTNPTINGTYTFTDYLRSFRDIDNDGIENSLDACPYASTPSWNPRISDAIYDPDGDGVPGQNDPANSGQLLAGTGCDPTPLAAAGDPDADGFTNRADNCPLVANATQADPDSDGIGSACDTVDTAPDGHLHEVCAMSSVNVGAPGSPSVLTCPEFVLDVDSDGFTRTVELHVGTDPQVSCGTSQWPADFVWGGIFNSTNKVDIADLNTYLAPVRYLDTNIGQVPGNVRWDISPGPGLFDKDINIGDLTTLLSMHPPMHEGLRSFSGPLCPWP